MSDRMPNSPQDFKKKAGTNQLLELPSGLFIKVRRVTLQALLSRGKVPNSLLTIVRKAVDDGETPDENSFAKDLDISQLTEMMELVDVVTCDAARDPLVFPIPEDDQRDENFLYVDELDNDDKMHIFRWAVQGVSDLESFRERPDASLGGVETS